MVRLTLNVDVAATAFLEVRPVLEYLQLSGGVRLEKRPFSPQDLRAAKKAIRAVKVCLQLSREFCLYGGLGFSGFGPFPKACKCKTSIRSAGIAFAGELLWLVEDREMKAP